MHVLKPVKRTNKTKETNYKKKKKGRQKPSFDKKNILSHLNHLMITNQELASKIKDSIGQLVQ